MNTKLLLQWHLFICTGFSMVYAQQYSDSCDEKVNIAKQFISGSVLVQQNAQKAIELLTPCEKGNHAEAAHYLGLLYLGANGAYKPVNPKKAFKFIKKASKLNDADAACNLAIMYQQGKGTTLNLNKARNWYAKSYNLGSSKAAFKLGVMHFKGLGNVKQNYKKALKWFKKSSYPMSDYYIALHHYYGFGVPVNKNAGIEAIAASKSKNSKYLLASFLENGPQLPQPITIKQPTQQEPTNTASEIVVPSSEASQIAAINSSSTSIPLSNQVIENQLVGSWQGKLIEKDWSETKIMRSVPITLVISKNNQTEKLAYQLEINNITTTSTGFIYDNEIYFEDLNIKLSKLYEDAFKYTQLNFNLLSAEYQFKKIGNTNYLIANLESYCPQLIEKGHPMQLVLNQIIKPKIHADPINTSTPSSVYSQNGHELSQDILQALAEAGDSGFIKLYPNPFKKDLLIQYKLEQQSNVTVSLYSFDGIINHTIQASSEQQPGEYIYYFNGLSLNPGVYVVRVTTNQQVHTKLIIKH